MLRFSVLRVSVLRCSVLRHLNEKVFNGGHRKNCARAPAGAGAGAGARLTPSATERHGAPRRRMQDAGCRMQEPERRMLAHIRGYTLSRITLYRNAALFAALFPAKNPALFAALFPAKNPALFAAFLPALFPAKNPAFISALFAVFV